MSGDNDLTILIPTRNRPKMLGALLQFLRGCGVTHRIVVADSSDAERLREVDDIGLGVAEIRHFPAALPISEKLIRSLETITTRFVVMLPDDDVTFPHAIDASLAFLIANPDHVAAQGYVLDFGIYDDTYDISRVRWFTPSIAQSGPIDRIYNLVRRYQPFLWAVFRTDVLLNALRAVRHIPMIVFQEMTIMNAVAAQGKIARLPHVYTLRGMEESLSSLMTTHPFYALLAHPQAFLQHYASYRENLAGFIRAHAGPLDLAEDIVLLQTPSSAEAPPHVTTVSLEHVLDLIHTLAFGPEIDGGTLNYTIQRMLGAGYPPVPVQPQWRGLQPPQEGDVVHVGPGGQRYLWRHAVLAAEPRNEIDIGAAEIERVEAQLAHYAWREPVGHGQLFQ